VAEAVGDRTAVLMDGGVRTGLDVLKAMSLGARACLIGRSWAFALAAQGERGVASMLATMQAELRTAMALTGCTDVAKADRDLLFKA
jgi:L-lactate dehydrogenase (cytochrome)